MIKSIVKSLCTRRKIYIYSWTFIAVVLSSSVLRDRWNEEENLPRFQNGEETGLDIMPATARGDSGERRRNVLHPSMGHGGGIINSTGLKSGLIEHLDADFGHLIDFVRDGDDLRIPPPNTEKKIVLYWTNWYNPKTSWEWRFGTVREFEEDGCSKWKCEFTYDRSRLREAHALLFKSDGMEANDLPERYPEQRWVWVDVESPLSVRGTNGMINTEDIGSHQFNWTMSYHISSDIMAMNGYLLPKNKHFMPIRANLLAYHKETLKRYLQALEETPSLEETEDIKWKDFVKQRRPVVWMSSNCNTFSKREEYVHELSKYIRVDKYGDCGNYKCGARYQAFNTKCWIKRLRKKYLFSLAFENSLCNHYISEKPYNPLVHGLVPIVWGGEGYEHFLPPGSYINARMYHPRELAELIQDLMKNPAAYGRYHFWRRFWKAKVRGSVCELCHRLHTDPVRGYHRNISAWRHTAEQCLVPKPDMFESDDWERIITKKL